MKRIIPFGIGIIFLVCVAVLLAQIPSRDAITRVGTTTNQQYSTYVVDAGKALAYAKQIMRGTPGSGTGESVESSLLRLEYKADNLSVDWSDITNKPVLQGASSISANQVEFTSDADGIFGTGTQDVEDALTYLDNVTLSQWPGSLGWGRIASKPTHWQWSLLSGRPSVWPGTLGAGKVTWTSDAGGLFGSNTQNVSQALSYLDDVATASRWPTWAEVQTQSQTGLPATSVTLNTTGFDGNFSSAHSNVQLMANRIDDLSLQFKPISHSATVGVDGTSNYARNVRISTQHYMEQGKLIYYYLGNVSFNLESPGSFNTFTVRMPRQARTGFRFFPTVTGDNVTVGTRGIEGYYMYLYASNVRWEGNPNTARVDFSMWGFYVAN